MRIGIAGLGVVGSACDFGFRKLGHDVTGHDPKHGTSLADLLPADVVFVCVPTPSRDGRCDTSIVEGVVRGLVDLGHEGVIAIRSTVTPGTTDLLIGRHDNPRICFVPEFLRERCSISDFVENQKLLAVGTQESAVFRQVAECFGDYPKEKVRLSPAEAEILKYTHNCFGALRVVFANEIFEVCREMDVDYRKVKEGLLRTSSLPDIYLDVTKDMRGYGSHCWDKDVPAFCRFASELGLDLALLPSIEPANDRFQKTPFAGTRS